MSDVRAEVSREARREAVPAVVLALVLLLLLALVSRIQGWELLSWVRWWVWLLIAVPEALLIVDMAVGLPFVRTRRAVLVLLAVLVAGSLAALGILIAALVTTSTSRLGGGELLLSALVVWVTNVIVFGLWFWELDEGGPVERARRPRSKPDFQFPQDENQELARPGWRPDAWDYLYVSLTNSIAFSPTDAMPLTHSAKLFMGLEAVVSALTVLVVGARAINILG